MSPFQALLLFFAGLLAGGLNALAGGGGFITLPAFIFTGVAPIIANTSGTIAVWPGILASMFAYRRNLQAHKHPLGIYLVLALGGATLGAFLLLYSTNAFFMGLLPFLLLFATLLFIFGKAITARLVSHRGMEKTFPAFGVYFLLFMIAVYGGYFGGGMGIMTLAVLALIGMEDIHEMNAIKTLLVMIINGIGMVIFVAEGKVAWSRCLVMTVGCVIGGYGAGNLVQRINPITVRRLIALIASAMTAYFFYRAYI